MADFVTWLYGKGFAKNGDANQLPFMEIEIQNEPNNPTAAAYQFTHYAGKFGPASGALYSSFGAIGYGEDHYLMLTGGVAAPQAQATNTNASGCFNNLRIIHDAIEAAYANGVPVRNYKATLPQAPMVGMALHPYSYITSPITDTGYWQNYSPAHPYGNACRDLGDTLNRWKAGWTNNNQNFPPVPLAFTEINFSASLTNNDTASLGNYLVDLFTWLYDHNTPRYTDVSSSQLRTMWYQGADSGAYLGIYQGQAGGSPAVEKQVTMQHCSAQPNIGTSQRSVAWDYYYLRNDHCY